MSDIQRVFASNMRAYRKLAHMTQENLAEKSGLHRTYIGGIEQQRINVSLKNVEKIATALDVDPALLFSGEAPLNHASAQGQSMTWNAWATSAPQGSYALCVKEGEEIKATPLQAADENLAVSILVALVNEGFRGNDLAEAYARAQSELLCHFRETRANAPHANE